MQIKADNVDQYIQQLPGERQDAACKLRKVIFDHLPKYFDDSMSYGMIGYVVPHSIHPSGYHCDTKLPLLFMNIASQKNFVAF